MLPVDPVAPVVPVALAAREVAADRAVLAAPAVVALAAGVTIFEAVVALAVLAALAAPVAPEDLEVLVDQVVPAVAVGSAPVGAEILLVRSASRAVVRPEVESPSAPSVKSSTTWKPRRSAAFGCPGVRVRRFGSRVVRH